MALAFFKLINAALQIGLFCLIPFIWWLMTARNNEGFFSWIGLKRVERKQLGKLFWWMFCILLFFLVLSVFVLYSLKGLKMATSEFYGQKRAAVPFIFIYAIFNTALPEELLFRGFLLKRLNNSLGFIPANLIQASLFGLLHGLFFFSTVGTGKGSLIILFTGTIAWFMGVINEKYAGGSILPSWFIHAVSNIFAGLLSAFSFL